MHSSYIKRIDEREDVYKVRLIWNQGAGFSFRPEEFHGRDEEIASLLRVCRAGRSGVGASVMIFGPPNVGKTSLLLKLKHSLQSQHEGAAPPRPFPFYFSFSKILSHPLALSQHFLQEYLWQLLAFLGDPPPAAFDAEAMCERLASLGFTDCREFLLAHRRFSERGDGLSALVSALSFPFTSRGELFHPVFLFDDFQYTSKLQGIPDGAILSILRPYLKSGHFPVIISGSSPGHVTSSLKREGLFGAFHMVEIGGLSAAASESYWSWLFDRRKLDIPAGIKARAAARLGHVPVYQRMFAEEVSFRNVPVADEIGFENLYALSVTEGQLNRYWREFFENAFPGRVDRARAVRFLKRVVCDRFPLDTFEGALSLMGASPDEGERILSALEFKGLLKADFEQLRFIEDPVLADFLYWAVERGTAGKSSSQIAASLVQAKLSRAASDSSEGEREKSIGTAKDLMRRWDCREVPALLFRYGAFRERFEGKGLLEVVIGMEKDPRRIRLPKISSVSTGYGTRRARPRFDFDLVAYGFMDADFSEDNLVIWTVDVCTEKTLSAIAVEHFENRCRLLSLEKSLKDGQLMKWILFGGVIDPAALELANRYDIMLTHLSQMRIFLNIFGMEEIEAAAEERGPADPPPGQEPLEFELVLPMKADTEVVAARVAEEVASYASLDKDSVDRIKMALIEACINAFEHSGSESGKVRLRYVLSPEKIELFVQDEGKGFRGGRAEESRRNRGWGLKLIRELVDDVEIVTGEKGTTVRMVKHLDAGGRKEGAGSRDPEQE